MLYEVAVIQKPTKKEVEEEAALEKLICGPIAICAASEQAAAIMATRDAKLDNVDPNRLEVLVRPFA